MEIFPITTLDALSGTAGAAFDWNGQNLTGVGTLGCGNTTITGTLDIDLSVDSYIHVVENSFYGDTVKMAELQGTGTGAGVENAFSIANTLYLRGADVNPSLVFSHATSLGTYAQITYTTGSDTLSFDNATAYTFDGPVSGITTLGCGAITTNANFLLNKTAGATFFTISGDPAAGIQLRLSVDDAGAQDRRWVIARENSAADYDFVIKSFDDAGSLRAAVLALDRGTGDATFIAALNVGGILTVDHIAEKTGAHGIVIGTNLTVNDDNLAGGGLLLKGYQFGPLNTGGRIAWAYQASAIAGYTFTNVSKRFVWDNTTQGSSGDNGVAWVDFDDGSASFAGGDLDIDASGNITDIGYIKCVSLADASAPNSSLYFSTTQSKLVWKDSGGTVRDLY